MFLIKQKNPPKKHLRKKLIVNLCYMSVTTTLVENRKVISKTVVGESFYG